MKRAVRTSRIHIFVVACVLFVFLAAVILSAHGVAYAVLPQNYNETVLDQINENDGSAMKGFAKDWWKGGEYLDISTVKKIVTSWFSNDEMYDFYELKNNPVVIAVIDSGITLSHEIFAGKYDENGAPLGDQTATGEYDVLARNSRGSVISYNALDGSSNVTDDAKNRHGTHVAGVIAELIHMLDLEKYIKIMPIKAGKPNGVGASFESNDVVEAIDYALSHGADVVNMSIESTEKVFDLVTDAMADKAVFVAAAGNGAGSPKQGLDSASQKCYPAAGKNVIGVMNYMPILETGEGMELRASSNYGPAYDLCAPGSSIFSADGSTDDAYKELSGTSMATPVVAFAAALATLKYRAIEQATGQEQPNSPREIAEKVKASSTSNIIKNRKNSSETYSLKALDLKEVVVDANDEAYAKIVYEEAEQKEQFKGHVMTANLYLDVMPSARQGEGEVVWSIEDEEGERQPFAEGFEATYAPADVVGETIIVAVWTVETDLGVQTVTVRSKLYVNYFRITKSTAPNIKVALLDGDGNINDLPALKKNETYRLTFSEYNNVAPSVASAAKWYVDGKLVRTGGYYDYTPNDEKAHTIYVKFNDLQTSVAQIRADDGRPEAQAVALYVTYALVGAIGVIVVAIVIAIAIKRAKAGKRAETTP